MIIYFISYIIVINYGNNPSEDSTGIYNTACQQIRSARNRMEQQDTVYDDVRRAVDEVKIHIHLANTGYLSIYRS